MKFIVDAQLPRRFKGVLEIPPGLGLRQSPGALAARVRITTGEALSGTSLRSWKSGSRRRAEAALWRATKAEGLPRSKTLRGDPSRCPGLVVQAPQVEGCREPD